MRVPVSTNYQLAQSVCVTIDGACNHADYDTAREDRDFISIDGQDITGWDLIDTCTKCKATRFNSEDEDFEWEAA